jgi:hypothetical protein
VNNHNNLINHDDTNDLSDSIDFGSKETRCRKHEIHQEFGQRFEMINNEIIKLSSSKEMYQNLRQNKNDLLEQKSVLDDKLNTAYKGVQDLIKDIELQTDTSSLSLRNKDTELSKKNQELSNIKKDTDKQSEQFETEEQLRDTEFDTNSKEKDSEIKDTLDNIKKTQIILEELIKISVKDRDSIVCKLDDVSRQVIEAKEPKFFSDALRQAERESKALIDKLNGFEDIGEFIDLIDDENDQLNKKLSDLSADSQINEHMKSERDILIVKIHDLNDKQNDLFNDNIDKLKYLQEIERKIADKNRLLPLLKDKINGGAQKALDDTKDLERDIDIIDKGTDRMTTKVDELKIKVDKHMFKDALDRIQDRIRHLNGENKINESNKELLKNYTKEHKLKTNELDLSNVAEDEVKDHNFNMQEIKDNLKTSTD